MSRFTIVLLIGIVASLAGLALIFGADSLATQWQPAGENAWGGETDVRLRQIYCVIGYVLLGFGLILNAFAAWRWMQAERRYTLGPKAP